MTGPDLTLARILAALDEVADRGDGRARHAASILRGARALGRRPIDDGEALAEVERLTAAGRGRAAIGIVAARMADDPRTVGAIARRLRRKKSGQKSISPRPFPAYRS